MRTVTRHPGRHRLAINPDLSLIKSAGLRPNL